MRSTLRKLLLGTAIACAMLSPAHAIPLAPEGVESLAIALVYQATCDDAHPKFAKASTGMLLLGMASPDQLAAGIANAESTLLKVGKVAFCAGLTMP